MPEPLPHRGALAFIDPVFYDYSPFGIGYKRGIVCGTVVNDINGQIPLPQLPDQPAYGLGLVI